MKFTTSITLAAYEKLKRYLHVDEPTDPMSIIHSVAHPAEEILEKFGVDTRNVQPGPYEAALVGHGPLRRGPVKHIPSHNQSRARAAGPALQGVFEMRA